MVHLNSVALWKVPGPKSRCELAFYILPNENPDLMFCGCPFGNCPAHKKFKNSNVYNYCKYYENGRNKLALRIAEMMPLPKDHKVFNDSKGAI